MILVTAANGNQGKLGHPTVRWLRHGTRHGYDPSYHDGARNVVYTGPDHLSYIQLPIVPDRRR
jgi:hypothetical protein